MQSANRQTALQSAMDRHRAGELAAAEALYRQVLAADPSEASAWNLLGLVLHQRGREGEAVECIECAVKLQPGQASYRINLGTLLLRGGKIDRAIEQWQRALEVQPESFAALCNLGTALRHRGKPDRAVVFFRRALALQPEHAETWNNLGSALHELRQYDEALVACHRALQLSPQDALFHRNRGLILGSKGRDDEALAAFAEAQSLAPGDSHLPNNIGAILQDRGELDRAKEHFRRALALNPHHAEAHVNLAFALLLTGDYRAGFTEFEWRARTWELRNARQNFPQPLWQGEPIAGRTLFLYAEQGLGDSLQFVRYLPMVLARGGRVIVGCQRSLKRLFERLPGVSACVTTGDPPPAFDVRCPMMSLAHIFGTTLETIPARAPYVAPDPVDVSRWGERMVGEPARLRVGLVWKSGPKLPARSLPSLSALAPLAEARGVRFYSLQKGEAAAEAKLPPPKMEFVDWTDDLHDLADTAALATCLDLIISVDTSVAHLAGALGKPAWILLKSVPDWRWGLKNERSPWYPSARLFRQREQGDWSDVIHEVARALGSLALAKI